MQGIGATGGALLPAEYSDSPGTRLLIIGGLALLVGLVLTSLNESLLSVLSGGALWPERVRLILIARHRRRLNAILEVMSSPEPSPKRTAAAYAIGWMYPGDSARVQATRLGNARRAAAWQTRSRWSLDAVLVWPRIELMLDQQQAAHVADARTDLAFLVNGCAMSGVAGIAAVGWLAGRSIALSLVAALVAGALSRALYLLAVPAALRLESGVQAAAIDLYRLELYKRLALRVPTTRDEERLLGRATNRLLAFAEPTADDVRAALQDRPPRGDDAGMPE